MKKEIEEEDGGLDMKYLKIMNLAMIAKLIWGLIKWKDYQWIGWIKEKYSK